MHDEENDRVVADYFAMLADDLAGRPYSKTQHRRALMLRLRNRSEASIEFKRQNIRDPDTIDMMAALARNVVGKRLRYRELIADPGLSSGARSA